MPMYTYEAVDPYGEAVTGSMEESSARVVTQILEERGLQVSAVEQLGERKLFYPAGRLSWADLNRLNDQLLAIVKSGMPLSQALDAFAKDTRSSQMRTVLERVRNDVEAGHGLAEALGRHPEHFPAVYICLVRAGEKAGNLAGVLSLLSVYTGRRVNLGQTFRLAVTYPAIVFVGAFAVLLFLMTQVVPMFTEIFSDFGSGLPGPTRFVVDLSFFIVKHFGWIIAALCIFAVGFVIFLRAGSARGSRFYFLDRIRSRLPVISRMQRAAVIGRFCRSLALLLKSGVPLLESLDLAGASSGSEALRRAVRDASKRVNAGERIADALSESRFFPYSFTWLLSTGEERGEMDETLLVLAEQYEQELAYYDQLIGGLLSPVLVVLAAILVGLLVITLYLPVFSLGDALS